MEKVRVTLVVVLSAIIITLIGGTTGGALRLENFHVPSHRVTGEEADLFCYFSLERNRSLYSLKWFKDGSEIFRYIPSNTQNIILRWVDGVSIDVEKSSMNRVHLKNLTELSSGTYSCEVSEDAPTFLTVLKEGEMTVLAGPRSDPELRGFGSSVTLGDRLQGNCTLRDGNPHVKLYFFINNFKVEEANLEHYPPLNITHGKQQLTLGLDLTVKEKHWTRAAVPQAALDSPTGSYIELKCVARMEPVENIWERVKYIHQANPTLRRESLRRQEAGVSHENVTTRGATAFHHSTHSDISGQLVLQMADILSVLNQGLRNLSTIQAEHAAASKEMLVLRRQELTLLRELPRTPIRPAN